VDRREPALLSRVGVGARGEQRAHGLTVARGRRAVERRHAAERGGDRMRVRPPLEQKIRSRRLAEERGEVERGACVDRPGARELGILVEELAQAVDVPDGGCLEDVERAAARRADRRAVDAVVVRVHKRRDTALVAVLSQLGLRRDERRHPVAVLRLDRLDQLARHLAPPCRRPIT
jgi:hypothetical protein